MGWLLRGLLRRLLRSSVWPVAGATVVGATVVGATVVGATVVGATVVGGVVTGVVGGVVGGVVTGVVGGVVGGVVTDGRRRGEGVRRCPASSAVRWGWSAFQAANPGTGE
ncbi:hypothetical protein J113_03855 [Mycobacterium tuberculosis CAS/NITR204]|uniref:Transmembrane protein n=1 Tax=Mycobacterium tuberculosis CAS/NITR204 TaxID=1310114 RepID=R4MA81_MYCTX|nr:hypothetical protein J113_03855 [Mycobacterium tuberculosis CAS/NITR204]